MLSHISNISIITKTASSTIIMTMTIGRCVLIVRTGRLTTSATILKVFIWTAFWKKNFQIYFKFLSEVKKFLNKIVYSDTTPLEYKSSFGALSHIQVYIRSLSSNSCHDRQVCPGLHTKPDMNSYNLTLFRLYYCNLDLVHNNC